MISLFSATNNRGERMGVQEAAGSIPVTRTNEKRDSEIADFRVPFLCSMSTVMLDLNPSNSTGLGS